MFRTRLTYSLTALLMLLAIGVRAFVPAGFMPDVRALAAGSFKMVICTLNGPQTVDVAGDFDPLAKKTLADDAEHGKPGSVCDFALTAVALDGLSHAVVAFALIVFSLSILMTPAPVRVTRNDHARLIAARGPPVFSV